MFGDIGTSPIYTLQTVFSPTDPRPVPVTHETVLGVVSLVFCSVMLIVTVTSAYGQINVPWINWLLLVSVLTLVFAFRSSIALAFAFDMAVTGTITITTLLFFHVARRRWRTPGWLLAIVAAPLLVVDLLFLGANLTKIVHGAWLPLVIAVVAFTVMTTWQRGRQLVTTRRVAMEGPLRSLVDGVNADPSRAVVVPGTAIFLNRGGETTPLALRANVEHNHVRHDDVVIGLDRRRHHSPCHGRGPRLGRRTRHQSGRDHARRDPFRLHRDHRRARRPESLSPEQTEGPIDLAWATYFLSKIELRSGDSSEMAQWRKRLFIATSHITADAAEQFRLPRDQVVLIGSHVEV